MREIKFRAWSKFPKMFLDMDDACYYLLPFGKLASITFDDRRRATYRDLDTVIQLYTGLKDCKGREIYEGDIVKIINVCTCDNCKRYKQAPRIVKVDFLDFGTLKLIATGGEFGNYETEIIGNIFENSELLQGGENE